MVVSFDATTAVTSASEWRSDPRWSRIPPLDTNALCSLDHLIVFAAHPDDETLGAGGILATASELSVPIRVVIATGEDQARRNELALALDELGVSATVDYLEFPDGGLKHHAEALARDLPDILSQSEGATWALAPWPGDRHGDHRTLGDQVARAGRAAGVEVLYYPVWLWQWGVPDDCPWEQLRELPLSDSIRHLKRIALTRFESQLRSPANPDGVLTEEFLEHFRDGREVVIAPSVGDHFDELHTRSDDPWSVRTRWYERRKRAVTVASLPRERFARALEIGCSIGELSAELVERCERLLAVDGSESAVAAARDRLRESPAATVRQLHVPTEWPPSHYDLVVISELAYYLSEGEWRTTIRRCIESLDAGGVILLCHWLGTSDDFVQTGEQVHRVFHEESGLDATVTHRESDFLLEVFGGESGHTND